MNSPSKPLEDKCHAGSRKEMHSCRSLAARLMNRIIAREVRWGSNRLRTCVHVFPDQMTGKGKERERERERKEKIKRDRELPS